MRNFNTSFAKNAMSLFANEAGQLLRAFADPATCLPRFIQSIVRTILVALSKYRQPVQSQVQASVSTGTFEIIGRNLLVMSAGNLGGGEHGYQPWDCRLSTTVS